MTYSARRLVSAESSTMSVRKNAKGGTTPIEERKRTNYWMKNELISIS